MRSYLITAFLGMLGAMSPSQAFADNGNISVTKAWSRASPGASTTGVVYLTVSAKGAPDQLIGVASTPIASSAELHESKTVNGIAQMAFIALLPIGQNTSVELAPGGYHFMLMGLRHPLTAGDQFPLTVRFQHAGAMTTTVIVERLGAAAPSDDMPNMNMGKMH